MKSLICNVNGKCLKAIEIYLFVNNRWLTVKRIKTLEVQTQGLVLDDMNETCRSCL